MKKTRNPQTGQLIETEPTPEELARLHAKASVGQRRVVGEIESNPLMVRYVAACVEAIRAVDDMRKLTMQRLQAILQRRDDARAAATDIIPLIRRLWSGMPPESVEGRALITLEKLSVVADEEREVIFEVITGGSVE